MLKHKVLIVEDEPKVAQFIKKGLEENNFKAEIASNGKIALEVISKTTFDIIILDLNLPIVSGMDVCAHIRSTNQQLPILILTAMGSTENKLNGFDNGADDYLVKPFEFRELLARIRVLIKRQNEFLNSSKILRVADLELHLENKTVKRNGQLIELTLKEYSLLELLMRQPNKIVSRAEIADKIWDINFDTGTNVIDVYINFLRKKIDKNYAVKLIHTHIGMGYTLKDINK